MRPIRVDRIRRHRLGLGPAPAYRVTRLIHKDDLPAAAEKLQKAWWEATPRKGPATMTALEQGDYVSITIAFD
jgi:hypothetical protein